MVSAVITSTLAGVCSRVRLRRLPLGAGWLRLSVADACEPGAAGAAVAAPARCCRISVDRAVLVLFGFRLLAVAGRMDTTMGGRSRLGALCAQASTGQRNEERAMEDSKKLRCGAQTETEVMI